MFDFIKNQWIMGKYDTAKVELCVTKGFITQEQANVILVIKQVM